MRQPLCLILCLAWLTTTNGLGDYDDGTVKSSLTYEHIPCKDGEEKGKAVLTVQTAKLAKGRPIVSLTAVLDVSNSMSEADALEVGERPRLDYVKLANKYVIDRLAVQKEKHKYGSVVFSTNVEELSPLEEITEDKAEGVKKKIGDIQPFGYTNLLGGVLMGLKQQEKISNADHVRAVLVFTDGRPTKGEIRSSNIYKAVKKARDEVGDDILIHVVAMGQVKLELLKTIASIGGGNFYHVTKEKDIPKAFAAILGGLMTEAALKVKYEIKPVGELDVVDVRSNGADIEWKGRTAICRMADLMFDEKRAVVISYRQDCPAKPESGIDVEGSYRDPVDAKDVDIPLGKSSPLEAFKLLPPPPGPSLPSVWDFRHDVADMLEEPAKDLEAGDAVGASDKIEDTVAKIAASDNYPDPFIKDVADDLTDLKEKLDDEEVTTDSALGLLEGLKNVVGGERPSSVDDKMSDTVRDKITTTQDKLMKESEKYVDDGKKPKKLFDLPYATSTTSKEGKVPEYKVKLAVGPPPVNETLPLSLTVVLDKDALKKGSNETFEKMAKVLKTVIKDLKSQPEVDTKLGIVTSSGKAETLLKLTNTSDIDVDKVIADIDAYKPTGKSAIGDGMKEAIRQQVESPDHKGSHAVFLITDGKPSDGDTIVKKIQSELSSAPHRIDLETFGVEGSDHDLLKKIAETGKGEHHDLFKPDDLGPSVGSAVWRSIHTKAFDVEVTAKPVDKDVVLEDSLPKLTTKKKGEYKMNFTTLDEGETREVIATVKAPKGSKTLMEFEIAYVDVVDGKKKKSETITVDTKPKGTTADRELDLAVLSKLEPAIEDGIKPENLTKIADAVYDTMPIVKDAKDADPDYKADLLDDLGTVAKKLEIAKGGSKDDLKDADWTMHAFVDTIKDQRAKGVGRPVLKVQDRYQPEDLKKTTEKYAAETPKKETKSAPATLRYKDVPKELTTDEQEMTVKFEIEAAKIPDKDRVASSLIVLVDSSNGTTKEDIDAVTLKISDLLKELKDTQSGDKGHMEVIFAGDSVESIVPMKSISYFNESTFKKTIGAAKLGGKVSFREGCVKALKMAKIFKSLKSKQDVEILAFVGGGVAKVDKKADAKVFVDTVDALGFPLKFVPVLMDDAAASYFDAFPPWLQKSVTPSLDAFKTEEHTKPTIGTRLTLIPGEKPGIEILDVEDGIKGEKGYVISDLIDGEKRTVDMKVKLPEDNSSQILRLPSLTMLDLRTQEKSVVHGEPLEIPRTPKETAEKLKDVQDTIRDAAKKIDVAVGGKDWPHALELASRTIGSIDETDVVDKDVDMAKTRLTYLAEDIYKIVGTDKDSDKAKLLSESILRSAGEPPPPPKPSVEDEPPEPKKLGKDSIWPGWKEGPGYSWKMPEPLKFDFDHAIRTKGKEKIMKIPLKLRAPPHKGDLVDAQVIILMDASAAANWPHEHDLAMTLLGSLAKRQGKRSVGIWTWNDETTEIYSKADFTPRDLDDAKAAVDSAAKGGTAQPTKVLHLIKGIPPVDRTVSVVYWISASQLPEVHDSIVESCIKRLKLPSAPTVIAFKPEVPTKEHKVLDSVSKASGGESHPVIPTDRKVPQPEAHRKIQDAAWKAVDRIEKTHSKHAKFDIHGRDGAKVINVTVDGKPVKKGPSIEIPKMDFGDEKEVEVVVDLSDVDRRKKGKRAVIGMDGNSTSVRSHELDKINQTVPVEMLKPRESTKVQTMYTMLDSAGWDLFYYLGRNRPKKALITAKEMRMQPKMAGLERRPDMKKLVDAYDDIGASIKDYISNRTDYKAIQNVSHLADDMTKELPHYSDKDGFLHHKSFPASLSSEPGVFRPRVTIETPPWEKSLPWKLGEHSKRIISIAAVFDTADRGIMIDREIGSLTLQKMVVHRIVKMLTSLAYTVDLRAISNASGNTVSLKSKRFTARNIRKIKKYLERVEQKGNATNLISSLSTGLPFLQKAVDSERMVLLFKDAASVGLVDNAACENILKPYITYPINPVKVLTYVIGKDDVEGTDPISDLTGGKRISLNHAEDILTAVEKSIEIFGLHAARSIRIDVKTTAKFANGLKMTERADRHPLGIVGDMKHSSVRPIDLEVQLEEFIGDGDIFDYTISYYRPKYKRWFKAPTKTFRARRARPEVIRQQIRKKNEIVPIVNVAFGQLKKGEIKEAALSMHKASVVMHQCLYQDDSLIRALFDYLARAHQDIIDMSKSQAMDTSEVENYLMNEGCALGMNIGGKCSELLEDLEYPETRFTPSFFVAT